jgi:hypothetical protein
MGSCANGGGYYHYSYSVVRGCDSEWGAKLSSKCDELMRHGQGSCPLIYMFPGARQLLRRFCMGCSSFNER